jgi:2-dehydropantoate 2-reductase
MLSGRTWCWALRLNWPPGIQFEIGQLDGGGSHALSRTVDELQVDNIAVTIRNDALAAMWEKFAFITSTAALTCLVGE